MKITSASIVQFTPRFSPSRGGVETHVGMVCRELVACGATPLVITVAEDAAAPEYEQVDGVQIIRMPASYKNNKYRTWHWIWRHRHLCIGPEKIFHIHDVGWWVVPLLPYCIKQFFITFHGWEGVYPVPLMNKLQRLFFATLAKKTIHIGAYIQQFYFDKPSVVLYGGTDVTSAVTEKINSATDLAIVFVGRLEKENDLAAYCALLDELKKRKRAVTIRWCGGGAYRKKCEEYGPVLGMVDEKKILAEIERADFVCAASYLSILTAQAVGKVVCALYSQPLKEAYLQTYPGSSTMIVSSDVTKAADQLIELTQHSEKKRALEVQSQQYARAQSWQALTDVYCDLWNNKVQ